MRRPRGYLCFPNTKVASYRILSYIWISDKFLAHVHPKYCMEHVYPKFKCNWASYVFICWIWQFQLISKHFSLVINRKTRKLTVDTDREFCQKIRIPYFPVRKVNKMGVPHPSLSLSTHTMQSLKLTLATEVSLPFPNPSGLFLIWGLCSKYAPPWILLTPSLSGKSAKAYLGPTILWPLPSDTH